MFSVFRSDWSLMLSSLSSLSCAEDFGMLGFPVCDPLVVFNILLGPPKNTALSGHQLRYFCVCDFYPFVGKTFTRRDALYKHYTQSQAAKLAHSSNFIN